MKRHTEVSAFSSLIKESVICHSRRFAMQSGKGILNKSLKHKDSLPFLRCKKTGMTATPLKNQQNLDV